MIPHQLSQKLGTEGDQPAGVKLLHTPPYRPTPACSCSITPMGLCVAAPWTHKVCGCVLRRQLRALP
jgi:hypothetical protein